MSPSEGDSLLTAFKSEILSEFEVTVASDASSSAESYAIDPKNNFH